MYKLRTIHFVSSIVTITVTIAPPQLWNTLSTNAASEIILRTCSRHYNKCVSKNQFKSEIKFLQTIWRVLFCCKLIKCGLWKIVHI